MFISLGLNARVSAKSTSTGLQPDGPQADQESERKYITTHQLP